MARDVRAFGLSDQGRVRKTNEDAFVCLDDPLLFVVADGMGGHNAGEVASSLAIEAITAFVKRSMKGEDLSWPYGIDPEISFDGNRLRTAIKLANRRVFRAAEEHDDYTGMGTTVVAAMVTLDKLIIGHVGDSRLYIYANGELRQMTTDDSWAATILVHELGDDKEGLATHPMRNVLTNVLGARDQVEIHVQESPRQGGELLLLCSDGLHGPLEHEIIARIVGERSDLRAMAHQLVDAALDQGGRDNVTVVLVECDGVPR
jgi:protein phosphatase